MTPDISVMLVGRLTLAWRNLREPSSELNELLPQVTTTLLAQARAISGFEARINVMQAEFIEQVEHEKRIHEAERDTLRAEVAALRKDAERYRKARSTYPYPEKYDDFIDAALSITEEPG